MFIYYNILTIAISYFCAFITNKDSTILWIIIENQIRDQIYVKIGHTKENRFEWPLFALVVTH